MNRSLGSIASLVVALSVAIFAVSMVVGVAPLSWASSLVLSWGYLVLAASFVAEAAESRKAAAYSGLAFAVVYAGFVGIVYFVQLTVVMQNGAAADVMKQLSYAEHGSLMFDLDLLGYAMLAASTFFLGLSLAARSTADRVLRILLVVHGVFVPACVLLPILNVFGTMPGDSGDMVGVAVLLFWCLYFLPVAGLSWAHFRVRPLPA